MVQKKLMENGVITAEELSKEYKQVSIATFFEKNKHLLGYDNPIKALLTVAKEGCDNSLDACEEAGILPDILVDITQLSEDRYKIVVEDNGPGIVREYIPKVFATLLFGSKFHRHRQSLTWDQDILIKENDKIKIVKIGEFVDKFLNKTEEIKKVLNKDIYAPAFDRENCTYKFRPISHVIRHKRENEIYYIKTKYGREVKVTGCHSLFTYDRDTQKIKEVEARNLKKRDFIIAPSRLRIDENLGEINILDYFDINEVKENWWYAYHIPKSFINKLFSRAKIVHKHSGGKSRKFFRFKMPNEENVDVVYESYQQYIKNGFLPLYLVLKLNLQNELKNSKIRTYNHGNVTEIPITLKLTPLLTRVLGFYVAEGHTHLRATIFDFNVMEQKFIDEIKKFARSLNLNSTTIECERHKTRVKFQSGVISYLFKRLCGRGAKNKKVPEFIFRTDSGLRQHFLDALYQGDGHKFKKKNQLILTTTSRRLCKEINYLWLLQGVVSSIHAPRYHKGLGLYPSSMYQVSIFGDDLNISHVFSRDNSRRKKLMYKTLPSAYFPFAKKNHTSFIQNNEEAFYRSAGLGLTSTYDKYSDIFKACKSGVVYHWNDIISMSSDRITKTHINVLIKDGYLTNTRDTYRYIANNKIRRFLNTIKKSQKLLNSDLALLEIIDIKRIDSGHEHVYDLSIPCYENFVGGNGGISCHNSRGIQGIGISAAVLYSQLTTGKSTKIISKTSSKKKAYLFDLHLNVDKNAPEILKEEEIDWEREHGTRIEFEIEAKYQKGKQSIDQYLKQTAIVNPHVSITYINPEREKIEFPRATNALPKRPKEVKPHPYGVELGVMIRMLRDTKAKTLTSFLVNDFSRISPRVAKEICQKANLYEKARPERIARQEAENLLKAVRNTKIMAPPTDCLSPIGEELILKSLRKEIDADFYGAVTRPPAVYSGFPFQIEAGIIYKSKMSSDEPVKLMRFANKVPLLYQQSACALTRAVIATIWKNYGLSQSKGALPVGPVIILLHIASVWVPFTSESKEAVAHYPEIIKEVKLALQDIGRKLAGFIRKNIRAREQREKANLFEGYIPELASSLAKLTKEKKTKIEDELNKMLKKHLPHIISEQNGNAKEKG